jgi:hypothetical protein
VAFEPIQKVGKGRNGSIEIQGVEKSRLARRRGGLKSAACERQREPLLALENAGVKGQQLGRRRVLGRQVARARDALLVRRQSAFPVSFRYQRR